MKKRGFTLVELLAVIVILSVIALIAMPIILNIIEDAKKSSLKDTTYSLVKAAENYLSLEEIHGKKIEWKTNKITNEKYVSFNLNNEEDIKRLNVKGKVPKKGRVEITSQGDTFVVAIDNNICAKKDYKEDLVKLLSLKSDDICLLTSSSDDLSSDTSSDIISTITNLSSRVDKLEKENKNLKENMIGTEKALDKIYPIGSIYVSTTLNTTDKVKDTIGGEWESYGNGKVLRGTTDKAEYVGGTDGNISLTESNLPSHSHSYTPSGSVTSTFTGTAVNTGNQSADHAHYFSATTTTNGSHTHVLNANGQDFVVPSGFGSGQSFPNNGSGTTGGAHWFTGSFIAAANGNHNHTVSGWTGGVNSNHTHQVTAKGTVTSTFKGTAGNTGKTGSSTSFSVLDPYITVYMYKRIK